MIALLYYRQAHIGKAPGLPGLVRSLNSPSRERAGVRVKSLDDTMFPHRRGRTHLSSPGERGNN